MLFRKELFLSEAKAQSSHAWREVSVAEYPIARMGSVEEEMLSVHGTWSKGHFWILTQHISGGISYMMALCIVQVQIQWSLVISHPGVHYVFPALFVLHVSCDSLVFSWEFASFCICRPD